MNTFLEFLSIAPIHQRKILVLTLSNEQLKLLIEIIYNTAMENIQISSEDKRKLVKYKLDIRRTLAAGISKKERRQRLFTISNILPLLIKIYIRWQGN